MSVKDIISSIIPTIWYQSDQQPVVCKEKIKILEENYAELLQMMQDMFEDAALMGVDEAFMKKILMDMINHLRSPII